MTENYGDSGSYDGGRSSERFLPPQDLEAERSVLGGMMLSKDAIADVVELLRGHDFYRPSHEMIYEAIIDLYGRGGSIKPAWYGDCLPERDFPAYVALSKAGNFPLDKFVSERIALDDVEQAFTTMKSGKVLRSVVEF